MSIRGLFLLLLIVHFSAEAQNSIDLVVEEFRIKEGFAEATPSISIVEASEIHKKGAITVSEVLTSLPGLFVAQNGGANQPTSVFIRGSESRHTLVLVDGMELNDPLNPSRAFDFSGLTTENIERIEIFRGAQSVHFGSDAIGGVINIITKQGAGPLAGNSRVEFGSYNSLAAAAEASGSADDLNYSIGASLASSDGFSAADKNLGNQESDGFRRLTLSARGGKKFSENTNINISVRATELQTDLDAFGGPTGDDPNYTSNARQFQAGAFLKSRALNKKLTYSLGFTVASNLRTDENPADPMQSSQATDEFNSMATKVESRNEYVVSDLHRFQFGLQLRTEVGHSESTFNSVPSDLPEHSINSNGAYGTYKFQEDRFFAEFGLRQDIRSQFDTISSSSLAVGLTFPENSAQVGLSYGTGFKTPSLYQLYSAFGNSSLLDEKSNSTELIFEKNWNSALRLSATYFINQYFDLIDFDLVNSKYLNIAKSSSRGTELQAEWQLSPATALQFSFTNLQAKNDINDFKLLRRPETTYSISGRHTRGAWESALEYNYVGDRSDIDPVSFLRIAMPAYDLVNLRLNFAYSKTVGLNFRITNLLNRKYQSVAGFGTSEQALFAGISKVF